MMLVVVPTYDRGDMMLVVVHTMVLTSSAELSLWILPPFSDLVSHKSYSRGVQGSLLGCTMPG